MQHHARTLLFELGLIMAAIVLGHLLDTPLGYVIAAVLACAFIFQWYLQQREEAQISDVQGLFGEAIPWTELPPPPRRPKIECFGYSFPSLQYDHDAGVWTEYNDVKAQIYKAIALSFTNNLHKDKKGSKATYVRAQIQWSYAWNPSGPLVTPAPWVNEPFGQIELPVGLTRKLIIGVLSPSKDYWMAYINSRLKSEDVVQMNSETVPVDGYMVLRLIDSTDECVFEGKWEWKEDEHHWPRIKQLSP